MILFLCTGNTCRSPMACALARAYGVEAESAGLCARPGAPASPRAIRAAGRYGVDLSAHRARQVDEDMLRRAKQIWVMTEEHRAALCFMYPEFESKIDALDPEIPDPYGGDDGTYARCAENLLFSMRRMEILPPEAEKNSRKTGKAAE